MTDVPEQGDQAPQVDEGAPIHYAAVQRGTPVYAADGTEVGRVKEVLDNYREHILDGVVFRDSDGALRFVDAPEVARTAERAVTLNIGAEEVAELPRPGPGQGGGGLLGRFLGRSRR
jgi:hypothetical protein